MTSTALGTRRAPVIPVQPGSGRRPPGGTGDLGDPPSSPGGQVRAHERLARLVVAFDILGMLLAMLLAFPLRQALPSLEVATDSGVALALEVAPLLVGCWVLVLFLAGAYTRQQFGMGFEEFQAVAQGTLVTGLLVASACYFGALPLSRGFVLLSFAVGAAVLVGQRALIRAWLTRTRVRGVMRHRTLLVGSVDALSELERVLNRERRLGFDVVGLICSDKGTIGNPLMSQWVPDGLDDIAETCAHLRIDTVMVVGGGFDLRNLGWELEETGVEVVVVPHLADVAAPRMFMRPVAGLPLLYVEEPKAARARSWQKRLFDVVVSSIALVILAPVMLVTALLIWMSDKGPIFYRQKRVGLHGEVFDCLKFRSMRMGSDALEAQLRAEQGHAGALWKMEDDPRITKVGKFIRRYSIDELPQLCNVLAGDMSLVGPRPQQQWEVDTYSDSARRRLHVRPGMTGLWQVSGRSRLTFEEAIRLDLYYRDNWSMVVDLMIVLKTMRAVVGSDGAY